MDEGIKYENEIKELQQLYDMKYQLTLGTNINDIYQQYRIWDKRKPLYQKALHTIDINHINTAIVRLAQTDLISKTTSDFNPFILLADVCLSLYQGQLTERLPLNYEFN